MLVKVCGITRAEDADAAVAAGAGALGFVFWPRSPRFIDPYRARAIVAALPPFVAAVGVFVNQPADYMNEVASLVGLTAVQLHGDEDAAFVEQFCRSSNARNDHGTGRVSVIKALAVRPGFERQVSGFVNAGVDRFLLDSGSGGLRGGTGKTFNVSDAADFVRPFQYP